MRPNFVNKTLRNKLQWNFNRNSNILIRKNTFENVVWKWWPFCLDLNVLTSVTIVVIIYGTVSPISLNPIRDEPCVFRTDDAPCWVRYWSAIARHHVIDRSQDDSVAMASCAISWRQILRYFWRPWLISPPPHLMLCISQSTLIAINEPFVVHLDWWGKNSGSNQTTIRVFEGNHCKSP